MQPIAISQFYKELWPDADVIELDTDTQNTLAQIIDRGGADKLLRFRDGHLAFLAQRFRRFSESRFDDFTLRKTRPSGNLTEYQKLIMAIDSGDFLATYYAYGLASQDEGSFLRMRILKFRDFLGALLNGTFKPRTIPNHDGSSDFIAIPFKEIPSYYFLCNYRNDDGSKQLKMFI